VARFGTAAEAAGLKVEPVRYPQGTRTAVDAAAAVGCEVAQIVKSLVCSGPQGPLLVLAAGHSRIDFESVALAAGADGPLRMATPDEARAATGFAIGGTPPFGHLNPMPAWIDPALLGFEMVYAAAGTPDSCVAVDPALLRSASGAEIGDFFVAASDSSSARDQAI